MEPGAIIWAYILGPIIFDDGYVSFAELRDLESLDINAYMAENGFLIIQCTSSIQSSLIGRLHLHKLYI